MWALVMSGDFLTFAIYMEVVSTHFLTYEWAFTPFLTSRFVHPHHLGESISSVRGSKRMFSCLLHFAYRFL